MKKFIMMPHAGCFNHGCEAIIRATVKMLNIDKAQISLYTSCSENDYKFELDKICTIIREKKKKKISTLRKKYFSLKEKLYKIPRDIQELNYINNVFLITAQNAVALCIGGDNYCYWGMRQILSGYTKLCHFNKIDSVLWGCSLDEQAIKDSVDDLKSYSLITIRESMSFDLLKKYNIKTNIVLVSDPAFTLDRQQVSWNDEIFNTNKVIGLNVSALMDKYESYLNATYNNFYNLIDYILKNTDNYIAMIPHVRQEGNDDLVPIKQLASAFNSDRILIVEQDYNCMQLKDIIARCRMFVGCRTHSTIAAYSTCVPTLVVGYSIKAKGICKDIFGTEENLLVDGRQFKTDNDLTEQFIKFAEKEDYLRDHLHKVMPDYINRAYLAVDAVNNLIKQK